MWPNPQFPFLCSCYTFVKNVLDMIITLGSPLKSQCNAMYLQPKKVKKYWCSLIITNINYNGKLKLLKKSKNFRVDWFYSSYLNEIYDLTILLWSHFVYFLRLCLPRFYEWNQQCWLICDKKHWCSPWK